MDHPRFSRRGLFAGAGMVALAAGCDSGPAGTFVGTPTPTPAGAPPSPSPTASPGPTGEAALRRKIASLLVVGFRGEQVGSADWIVQAIANDGLGGVILFDKDQLTGGRRNITSRSQVTGLIRTLRAASPGRLIVSMDQEGGQVARLNPGNGFPATRTEAEIGAANAPSTTTRAWAQGMVNDLVAIGVGLNYAPVVDLNVNPSNPAMGALGRSFSADPAVVVANATEEIAVHRAGGVRTVLKHFPGFGSATGNTDFGVVDVSGTWHPTELTPFRQLISAGTADAVMVAHLLNRQLDPGLPASLSPAVVGNLLRGQLGWTGPVVSDDLQAAAITQRYGRAQAVTMALRAGVDLLVFANQQVYDQNVVRETVDTVVGLVKAGTLTEARIDESVARVDALRPRG